MHISAPIGLNEQLLNRHVLFTFPCSYSFFPCDYEESKKSDSCICVLKNPVTGEIVGDSKDPRFRFIKSLKQELTSIELEKKEKPAGGQKEKEKKENEGKNESEGEVQYEVHRLVLDWWDAKVWAGLRLGSFSAMGDEELIDRRNSSMLPLGMGISETPLEPLDVKRGLVEEELEERERENQFLAKQQEGEEQSLGTLEILLDQIEVDLTIESEKTRSCPQLVEKEIERDLELTKRELSLSTFPSTSSPEPSFPPPSTLLVSPPAPHPSPQTAHPSPSFLRQKRTSRGGGEKVEFLQKVLNQVKKYKIDMRERLREREREGKTYLYPPVAVLAGRGYPTPKNILFNGPNSVDGFDFDSAPMGVCPLLFFSIVFLLFFYCFFLLFTKEFFCTLNNQPATNLIL